MSGLGRHGATATQTRLPKKKLCTQKYLPHSLTHTLAHSLYSLTQLTCSFIIPLTVEMSTPTDPPSNPSPGPTMHHVILDSGGIIKGQTNTYHKLGAKFWTISEVLGEIRDMKARERLEMLPVDLEVRTPSEKAMHAVSKFAKQTGDFAALSLVDLKVMALSYDLECQVNGVEFLRETPKVSE